MLRKLHRFPASGLGRSVPSNLTPVRHGLVFSADDDASGCEPWATNGTRRGTHRLKQIGPADGGSLDCKAEDVFVAGSSGRAFFATRGKPWKTDGTKKNTRALSRRLGEVREMTTGGSRLFFARYNELWTSDGSRRGTALLTSLSSTNGHVRDLQAVGRTLFFGVFTPGEVVGPNPYDECNTVVFEPGAAALWREGATGAGPSALADGFVGSRQTEASDCSKPPGDPDFPLEPVRAGRTLYFSADDGTHGRELWRSDGSAAGTAMVKDINPGPAGSATVDPIRYFDPGPAPSRRHTAIGSTLYFTADDGTHGTEWWRTNGSTARTVRLADAWGFEGTIDGEITRVKDEIFFVGTDVAHGTELWRSDGSAKGTRLVKDLRPGSRHGKPLSSAPSQLTRWRGRLYFTAHDRRHGRELWRSDGTRRGTKLVRDLRHGRRGSRPDELTAAGRRYLFFTSTAKHRRALLWAARRAGRAK